MTNYILIHAFVPDNDPKINFHYSDVEPRLEVSKPMSYSDARLALDKEVSENISQSRDLALLGNDSLHLIFHTTKVISYFEEIGGVEWWELKEVHGENFNVHYPKEKIIDE